MLPAFIVKLSGAYYLGSCWETFPELAVGFPTPDDWAAPGFQARVLCAPGEAPRKVSRQHAIWRLAHPLSLTAVPNVLDPGPMWIAFFEKNRSHWQSLIDYGGG